MKGSLRSTMDDLMITGKTKPPVPYDEKLCPQPFWPRSDFEDFLPSKGFITDYVYATRGIESPTRFCAWAAVWILSTIIYRDAWLDWGPLGNFYPNFYIVLVAPPRINPKSTALKFGLPLVEAMPSYFKDPEFRIQKTINLIKSKATPQALMEAMRPVKQEIEVDGEPYTVSTDSKCGVFVSELATFIGKEKFNAGLVEQLTNFYDCPDHDQDNTLSRGQLNFRNIYLTILGATTPQGIEESMPSVAIGGGFLSRTVFVVKEEPEKFYPFPRVVEGAPSRTELTRRLAWLAYNSLGPYTFSDDAVAFYEEWYKPHRVFQHKDQDEKRKALMQRFDIHLVKMALIMRIQRYAKGNVITRRDFEDALHFLEGTYDGASDVLSTVGADYYSKAYSIIVGFIKRRPNEEINRKTLLNSCSGRQVNAELVTKIVSQLQQEGKLIIKRDGKEVQSPSKNGREIYKLKGGSRGKKKTNPTES